MRGKAALLCIAASGMLASGAQAQPARRAAVAAAETREAIRDQIANYALLVDGDGLVRDMRVWANALWTTDAVFQVYDASGRSIFGNDVGRRGRATIYRTFGGGTGPMAGPATRHLFLNLRFDRIAIRSAHTRMVGYIVRGWQTAEGDVRPAPASSGYVYHIDWRRDPDDVWRIARSTVYCAFNCIAAPGARPAPR